MAPPRAAVRIDTMICGARATWVTLLLITSIGELTPVAVSPAYTSRQVNRTRNSSARALVETKGAAGCYTFIRMFNTLTADGDLFIAAGAKVSALECQNACLGYFRFRVCVAAIHGHSGHCLLAGYQIYPNPRTTHFRRLCRKDYVSSVGLRARTVAQVEDKLGYYCQQAKRKRQRIDAAYPTSSGRRDPKDFLEDLEQAACDYSGVDVVLGRACFTSKPGMESRFHTGVIGLPAVGPAAEVVAADLCRRECEQLVFCVGFDVIEDTGYCPYTEIRPGSNLYFTLYLRSC